MGDFMLNSDELIKIYKLLIENNETNFENIINFEDYLLNIDKNLNYHNNYENNDLDYRLKLMIKKILEMINKIKKHIYIKENESIMLNLFDIFSNNMDIKYEDILELEKEIIFIKDNFNYNTLEYNDIFNRFHLMTKKYLELLEEKKESTFKLEKEKLESNYSTYLNDYFNVIDKSTSDKVVFMFSGVGKIENIKGNRPIRLTNEFLSRNIPVLYSFWRWKNNGPFMDKYDKDIIFQSPVDKTLEYMLDIAKHDFKDKSKIFIISFPYPPVTKYIEVFKFYGWKVVYDIRDDWEEFNLVNQAKWYEKEHELYCISKSHITTAVSKPLIQKFKPYTTTPIHLLPNALDSKFMLNYETNHKRTKIGYVGHLTSSWFDWDSMIKVANMLPQYTFEIIGHSMSINKDSLPNNIVYLGPKTFDEVIEYSKSWKLGLIPFTINPLSRGVDPIKVYEYLALGLKVVSFEMPQIHDYPEVKWATNVEDFSNLIIKSMNEQFNSISVNRWLQNNKWSNRIDSLLDIIKFTQDGSDNYD